MFQAVLLDIDHSPRNLLHSRHGAYYEPAGLRELAAQLHPGGVFALWSDDPPDEPFLAALGGVFATADAQVVSFHNPLLERDSASTVVSSARLTYSLNDQNTCHFRAYKVHMEGKVVISPLSEGAFESLPHRISENQQFIED